MASLIVASQNGTKAIIQTRPATQVVISGVLKGDKGSTGPSGPGVPAGGTPGQFLSKNGTADYQAGWVTPAAGNVVQNKITQTNHGFSTGQIIRLTVGGYFLSQADAEANADVLGIVGQVIDASNFYVITEGYVTGLNGLVPGLVYFLSQTMAGQMTTVEPTVTNQISKPLLIADSTTSGYFHNYRGVRVGV